MFLFPALFTKLDKWMYGQTMAKEDDGTLIYYPEDVFSFLSGILGEDVPVYD